MGVRAGRGARAALILGLGWIAPALLALGCGGDPPPVAGRFGRDIPRPKIQIDQPLDGSLIAAGSTARVTVTGTVSADAVSVSVKGIDATLAAGRFTAADVPLREGDNLLVAEATNKDGGHGTNSVVVSVDRTAPQLSVTLPLDGATIIGDRVTVVGGVTDLVAGGPAAEVTVTVDGVAAQVAAREFVALDVPLVAGAHVIQVVARDAAGNQTVKKVSVLSRSARGATLVRLGGDGQRGAAGATLPLPLVVELRDPRGAVVAGRRVEFTVQRGAGLLAGGGKSGRDLLVKTDLQGHASVALTLAGRSGVAASLVRASLPGVEGDAVFVAGTTVGAAARIVVDDGDNQRGAPSERLPHPLIAQVLDATGNPVPGVPVVFTVDNGGGRFNNDVPPDEVHDNPSTTVTTDVFGRARTAWILGGYEGPANNAVIATFKDNARDPIQFAATGIFPGVTDETRVSGEVLSMTQEPIAGVKVTVNSPSEAPQSATTDASGRFAVAKVPPGLVTLALDVSQAQGGPYPLSMTFELLAMAGRENKLPRPIYLPRLDAGSSITVDEKTGGSLKMADVPGVELEIAPGSATFAGGSRSGTLTLTQVNNQRVPMSPPGGTSPSVVGALQPGGTKFDPPARLRYPNSDGLPPGQVLDIATFDHDMNRFVTVGTAQVSEDGKTILSDVGQGMPFAGWHYVVPPTPPPTTPQPCELPPMHGIGAICPRWLPDPSKPGQYLPRIDEHIPSHSQCRGACGLDCPHEHLLPVPQGGACIPDDRTICRPFTLCNLAYAFKCTYHTEDCGSAQGCVDHDQCYDDCAARFGNCGAIGHLACEDPNHPVFLPECQCLCNCDLECLSRYGAVQCGEWARGFGPQPDRISFTSELISAVVTSHPDCQ